MITKGMVTLNNNKVDRIVREEAIKLGIPPNVGVEIYRCMWIALRETCDSMSFPDDLSRPEYEEYCEKNNFKKIFNIIRFGYIYTDYDLYIKNLLRKRYKSECIRKKKELMNEGIDNTLGNTNA